MSGSSSNMASLTWPKRSAQNLKTSELCMTLCVCRLGLCLPLCGAQGQPSKRSTLWQKTVLRTPRLKVYLRVRAAAFRWWNIFRKKVYV